MPVKTKVKARLGVEIIGVDEGKTWFIYPDKGGKPMKVKTQVKAGSFRVLGAGGNF